MGNQITAVVLAKLPAEFFTWWHFKLNLCSKPVLTSTVEYRYEFVYFPAKAACVQWPKFRMFRTSSYATMDDTNAQAATGHSSTKLMPPCRWHDNCQLFRMHCVQWAAAHGPMLPMSWVTSSASPAHCRHSEWAVVHGPRITDVAGGRCGVARTSPTQWVSGSTAHTSPTLRSPVTRYVLQAESGGRAAASRYPVSHKQACMNAFPMFPHTNFYLSWVIQLLDDANIFHDPVKSVSLRLYCIAYLLVFLLANWLILTLIKYYVFTFQFSLSGLLGG